MHLLYGNSLAWCFDADEILCSDESSAITGRLRSPWSYYAFVRIACITRSWFPTEKATASRLGRWCLYNFGVWGRVVFLTPPQGCHRTYRMIQKLLNPFWRSPDTPLLLLPWHRPFTLIFCVELLATMASRKFVHILETLTDICIKCYVGGFLSLVAKNSQNSATLDHRGRKISWSLHSLLGDSKLINSS